MKTKLSAILLAVILVTSQAFSQPAKLRNQLNMDPFHLIGSLNLTADQKQEFNRIKFDLMKKQIDLRAKIANAKIDYEQLASASSPDQSALESKLDEISRLQAQVWKNRLDSWFAVNKILTPEQQKIWKRVLEHPRFFQRAMVHRMQMMRNNFMKMGSKMRHPVFPQDSSK
ncbi:MAG: Spy/CpxP family protein refolding chaperone [Candidatus Kryptoniota bacterium]